MKYYPGILSAAFIAACHAQAPQALAPNTPSQKNPPAPGRDPGTVTARCENKDGSFFSLSGPSIDIKNDGLGSLVIEGEKDNITISRDAQSCALWARRDNAAHEMYVACSGYAEPPHQRFRQAGLNIFAMAAGGELSLKIFPDIEMDVLIVSAQERKVVCTAFPELPVVKPATAGY